MNLFCILGLQLIVYTNLFASEVGDSHSAPKPKPESSDELIVEMNELADDISIPKAITESLIPPSSGDQNFRLSTSTITFDEVDKNVLIKPKVIFKLPRGGGHIQLSKYWGPEKGRFTVSMGLTEGLTNRIFFISRAKARVTPLGQIGLGCSKFAKISAETLNDRKFQFTTNNYDHISNLGGTFVLANVASNDVPISQVTIEFPEFPTFSCEVKNK